MEAGAGVPCISRRSPDRRRFRVSAIRRGFAARPNAGSPTPSCESACGRPPARSIAPSGAGSSKPHHSRKPRRCQAMTVSGFTMTSAVRQPVQRRASPTQSHRSVFASRTRRDRVRCSTCNWCRKASTSSWSSARERSAVRRVRRNETSTDFMARQRIHRRPQHQLLQQERPFH